MKEVMPQQVANAGDVRFVLFCFVLIKLKQKQKEQNPLENKNKKLNMKIVTNMVVNHVKTLNKTTEGCLPVGGGATGQLFFYRAII